MVLATGFANNAYAGSISPGTIDVGNNPFGIAVNSITNKVYVTNQGSNTVTVIDGSTDTIITIITVGSNPISIDVNSATNKVYVANSFSNTVSVIDILSGSPTENQVIAIIPVGNNPGDVAVNSVTNKVYVTNTLINTVSVIDGSTDSVTATVLLSRAPIGVAVNPSTNKVYVTYTFSNAVTVIDGATNTEIFKSPFIPVGNNPSDVTVNPDTNKIYAANQGSDTVSVIDGSIDSVTSTISLFANDGPFGADVDPATNRVFITNSLSNTVSVIDGATATVTAIYSVENNPRGVAVNPITNKVYVTNTGSNTVSVIDISANNPPVAKAGEDQTVNEGTLVTLDGTDSSDPEGDPLTFQWIQLTGPTVTFSDAVAVNPTFTAPQVDVETVLTFQLIVNDGSFDSVPNTVDITVNDLSTILVELVADPTGVLTADVPIGDVAAGQTITLQFETPPGSLPLAQLQETVIPFGVNANDVFLSFLLAQQVATDLPPPPIDTALFLDIDFSGLDLSDVSSFQAGQLPSSQFLVNKDFSSAERFDDGCPVIPVLLLDEDIGQWEQIGNPNDPTANKVYVAIQVGDKVSVIDGFTNTIIASVPVGVDPFGVGVNSATNKVYVANSLSNTVSVIDIFTDTEIATIPVGFVPFNVAVNPDTNKVYVTNQISGTVSVIDGSNDSVIDTIPVGIGPIGVGVNPATNKVYVTNTASNTVSVIDGSSDSVTGTIIVQNNPIGVDVNPDTNKVYVTNFFSNTVTIIDGSTDTEITTIPVGFGPIGVDVNPATNKVYVTNLFSNTVSVIDGSTDSVIATIPVGDAPQGVAVNPNTNTIFVTNVASSTVSVIDGFTDTEIDTISTGVAPGGLSNTPQGLDVNTNVQNPVRDPASDVLDVTTGEILQCAYIADNPHLSKFAIGGIKALFIGGGVSSTGGSSPVLNSISYDGVTTTNEDGTIEFGGVVIDKILPINNLPTQTVKTGVLFKLRLPFYEDSGVGSLQHVAVYFLRGDEKTIDDSQTSIIYKPNDPVEISDSPSFISNVTVNSIVRSAYDVDIIFGMVFNFPTDEPVDIKIRSWDKHRRSSDITFNQFLQVVESDSENQLPVITSSEDTDWSQTVESSMIKSTTVFKGEFDNTEATFELDNADTVLKNLKIPLWIKNNANWWSQDEISDDDFVAGMKYLIEQKMMDVPQHKVTILEPIHEIVLPDWVKNNAAWWAEGLVSDQEFVQAIEWLIDEGVMTVK